ncbi:MAG: hypothetical protein FVQ79_07725 [Planctomycetes bacterium]|nr:hypothetical protein [Planctomycetota bacterium]
MRYDGIVKQLQIKLAVIFAIRHSMRFLSVLGFLLAIGVLIVRLVFSAGVLDLLWGLLVFIPGIVLAVFLAFRQIPTRKSLHAMVDSRSGCGGLIMASDETDIGNWESNISVEDILRIRWKWSRPFGIFFAAMAFVIFSFAIPQRYVNATSHQQLDINEDMTELLEQVNVLKEEDIITDEEVAQFAEKLEQLQDSADGSDPVKTWESLDHLKDSLKKKADQATADALSQTEELTQAETFAEGLSKDGAALSQSQLLQAMADLASMTKDMALENEMLQNSLKAAGFNPSQLSELSAEELEKLMKALRACKGQLSNCVGNMCKVGLADLKMLKRCEKLGQCNSKGLMAFLSECEGMGMCQGVAAFCSGNRPGRGGISRGRGDAPMMWGDLSTKDNTKFQEKILPQANMAALKDSSLVGVSLGAPQVEQGAAYGGDGNLDISTAAGGQAKTHKILPRHRGTVKRYFER